MQATKPVAASRSAVTSVEGTTMSACAMTPACCLEIAVQTIASCALGSGAPAWLLITPLAARVETALAGLPRASVTLPAGPVETAVAI